MYFESFYQSVDAIAVVTGKRKKSERKKKEVQLEMNEMYKEYFGIVACLCSIKTRVINK